MEYPRKELFCLRDWRGKPFPLLAELGLEWVTVVPTLPGKIVVIEFWATWCKICHEAIPLLNEIHREYKDDVVVIGVTQDNSEKVKNWLRTSSMEYYVAHDVDGKLHSQIGIKGLPNLFVLDTKGIVQWQGTPMPSDPENAFGKKVIQKMLTVNKKSKPPAKLVPVTEDLIFSSQPTEEQLRNLQLVGIKSVLNLRSDDETGFLPSEDKLVNSSIEYSHVPIKYLDDISERNISDLLARIGKLPKPCLVHCNVGLCACAAVLLKVADEEKRNNSEVSRHQILEWGADLGFNFADQPKFFHFLGMLLEPPAKLMPVTEDLIFSSQPTIEQLRNLQLVGIKSVLNLRSDDEAGFIPNEDKLVDPSIEYAQIPIKYLDDIGESKVGDILAKLGQLPKPCLVHCNVGLCACAAVLLKAADEERQNHGEASRQQFLEWGADLGFNFADQPKFFQFLGQQLGK